MSSIYYQCLTTALAEIQGLALTGIASSSIVILEVPTNSRADIPTTGGEVIYPYVVIAPIGSVTVGGEDNARDDYIYPVVVGMIDNRDTVLLGDLDRNLLWAEKITDHFMENRFAGVTGMTSCKVQPLSTIAPDQWRDNSLFVSGLILNFEVTKVRRAA